MIRIVTLTLLASLFIACKPSRGRIEVENPPAPDQTLPGGGTIADPGIITTAPANLDLVLTPDSASNFTDDKVSISVTPSIEPSLASFSGSKSELQIFEFTAEQFYQIKVIVQGDGETTYSSENCGNESDYQFVQGFNQITIKLCISNTSNVTITPELGNSENQ